MAGGEARSLPALPPAIRNGNKGGKTGRESAKEAKARKGRALDEEARKSASPGFLASSLPGFLIGCPSSSRFRFFRAFAPKRVSPLFIAAEEEAPSACNGSAVQ